MYKIYLSTFSPFWNNSDINYPDFEKFDTQDIFNFESTSWTEIPNGTLQWIQSNSAWVQIDPQTYSINYLGVLDTHTNKKYYFFVIDEFDRTAKTIKLNLELDNWLTYGKNMLDKLKGNNAPVYFNKKHMNRYSIVDNLVEGGGTEIVETGFSYEVSGDDGERVHNARGWLAKVRQAQPYNIYDMKNEFKEQHGTIPLTSNRETFSANHNNSNSPSNVTNNTLEFIFAKPTIINAIEQAKNFMIDNNITDLNSSVTITYKTPKLYFANTWGQGGELVNTGWLVVNTTTPINEINTTTILLSDVTKDNITLKLEARFRNGSSDKWVTNGVLLGRVGFEWNKLVEHSQTPFRFNWGQGGGLWHVCYMATILFVRPIETEPVETKCVCVINIRGTKTTQSIIPQATTYNTNFQNEQQHLLNECDFTEYGNNKINLNKQNYKIPPYKNAYVDQLYSRSEPVWRHQWLPNEDEFFDIGNGYYLYGVVKYPLTPTELDQNMVKFLGSNISSTLNVFFPITVKPMENNALFKYNTKGLVESSFGDLLTGIIASPISPTSLSTKCVNAKTLFNKPPYNPTTIYHQMSGFALNAFELKHFQECSKTPYGGDMFKPFTTPTTEQEKWDKKLTTLDWRNETLLLAPQFLEYYLTNGTNQININNFVNSQSTDKNYMFFSWALTPISCLLYVGGLFDINRFESQKNIIAYSGSIPANSASYNQWVLNNSASINMGLESAKASRDLDVKHAKQNQVMGAINSIGGIAAGIAGGKGFGAAMGIQGVMQGFNQAHQAKQSIEKADLTYKNYQSTIAGANLDAQTKTTAISSDDATFINTFGALSPLSLIYKGLKVSDCQAIWFSCLIGGYNVNNVYNFNEYDNRTFYNYLKVSDIAGQVLQTNGVPQEYKDWFISKLTSGVRLWKTNMNYQLDNKENFIDRIDNAIIPIPPTTPTRAKVTTIKKGKTKNGK